MKNETTIERISDRELSVTRTFDAPARLVFEAWSKPEIFKQWWVPKSLPMKLLSYTADIRVGGTYRLEFGVPGRDEPVPFFGKYLEVAPHTRLVWTNEENPEGPAVTTVTFEAKGDKTLLTLRELHPSKASADEGMGAAEGLPEQFGQLDEHLAHAGAARA